MDPKKFDSNDIELTILSKNFEYEKISREIDQCDDVNTLKKMLKCYVKLHFKTQETLINLHTNI